MRTAPPPPDPLFFAGREVAAKWDSVTVSASTATATDNLQGRGGVVLHEEKNPFQSFKLFQNACL